MTDAYASVNGHRVSELRLCVANVGPWYVDVDFEESPQLSGRVALNFGRLELSGTIDPEFDGAFADQRKTRIVAGGNGWGSDVTAKPYHNDAGIRARTVAEDAAREVGETIGTFVPTAERIGIDYTRKEGPASRVLERTLDRDPDLLAVPWWVDYAGVTHAGPRPEVTPREGSYEVLAFDPRDRVATLAVDDPGDVVIGSVLSERLAAPATVRELEITMTDAEVRVRAWCGGSETSHGNLAGLFRQIVDRAMDARLLGKYRYRVYRMSGERVELQAVRKGAGLPDIIPVSMWPGIPGAHAKLTPGALVVVEFFEGDPTLPAVTGFAGKGGPGHEAEVLELFAERVELGGENGAAAARAGDSVESLLPPAIFTGTIGGAPASGVLTFTTNKILGTILNGSTKVGIAT